MGNAQTICQSGPLFDNVIQVDRTFDTYNVYDCQLGGQVLFNDSTIKDTQYPFIPTRINVGGSTVAAGGFLGIMGLTFLNKTAASIQQSLTATIQNNVFLLDSYFQVNGSLPQGSSLTFQNNTMSASARNPLLSLQGLALFVLTGTMFESVTVSLTSNDFSISGTGSQVGSAVIAHDLIMRAGSSISVSDNNFEWSGVTGSALTFDGVSNVKNIVVVENAFNMTTAASLLATGHISGDGSISFSGNNASLSATTDQAILPMAYPSTSVFVEDNTIHHNSDTFIAVEEWVSEPQLGQDYSFNVNRNTLHKVSGSVSTPIILFGRFSLPTSGSIANLFGNKVTSELNTTASVLVAATTPSCTPAANVSIFFENNSLPWADEPTAAQLFSHSLLGLATGQCNDTTSADTTSAETTSADTTSADTTSTDTTSADTTSADATSVDTTSADTTSADATSDDITSADATSVDTTSADTTSADATSDDITSADTTTTDNTTVVATPSAAPTVATLHAMVLLSSLFLFIVVQ